jgi:hypothetical protein
MSISLWNCDWGILILIRDLLTMELVGREKQVEHHID